MESANPEDSASNWEDFVQRLVTGEPSSQVETVDRFTERLLHLIDRRLSPSLARRLDAEDVVQSVFRSFFRRSHEFSFRRSGDLWRLLATMAVNKVRKQAARHGAAKRDYRREQSLPAADVTDLDGLQSLLRDTPTPDQLVAFEETVEQLVAELTPLQRSIFQMRLDGDSLTKISSQLQKSQRTVRRNLQSIRARMVERLLDQDDLR